MSNESVDVVLARLETKVDGLTDDVVLIVHDVCALRKECKEEFVSNDEFWPVKAVVFSGVGLVLTAVLGALVAMVVHAAS